jgi:hypothetical protein
MFLELECHNCPRTFTVDMHGKTALEDKEKYDSFMHGRRYNLKCFCGHDLHIMGSNTKEDPILKRDHYNPNPKNDYHKVAEI